MYDQMREVMELATSTSSSVLAIVGLRGLKLYLRDTNAAYPLLALSLSLSKLETKADREREAAAVYFSNPVRCPNMHRKKKKARTFFLKVNFFSLLFTLVHLDFS